jgi:hypothetical protein
MLLPCVELRAHFPRYPAALTGRHALVACLLVWYWIGAVTAVRNQSATFDEGLYLTGGYSYWTKDDYRLNPDCSNLPQRWAALPALWGGYTFPTLDQPAWRAANVWEMANQFLYQLGNDAGALLLGGRAMIALFGVGLGLVVYLWARRLFGEAAGLLSLALYAFCPAMLAHGARATADLTVTLFFTLSVWCLWGVMHRASPARALGSALVMAALLLSKYSAVLIVPIGLILLAVRLAAGRPLTVRLGHEHVLTRRLQQAGALAVLLLVHGAVVVVVIWAAFGFRYSPFRQAGRGDRLAVAWAVLHQDAGVTGTLVQTARQQRLLPEAYLYGFSHTVRFAQERPAFFNGDFSPRGSAWFFPYCLLVKTPLSLFALLAVAALGVRRPIASDPAPPAPLASRAYNCWPLLVLLGVYWTAAIRTQLNIGHRHILPTYPAMLILAGAAGRWLVRRQAPALGTPREDSTAVPSSGAGARWLMPGLVLGLALVFVAESLMIRPHYLAYFNRLAGGPAHGYRHLVDSSLDWGQDLPGLARWLDSRSPEDAEAPVYLSYFGTARPEYYDIRAEPLPGFIDRHRPHEPEPLRPGVYCISATMLQAVYLAAPGPWTERYEQAYRELRAFVRQVRRTRADPAARRKLLQTVPEGGWDSLVHLFEHMRFARLCTVLRQRPPDDQVGYSILIYRVSDVELARALDGPAPLGHPP